MRRSPPIRESYSREREALPQRLPLLLSRVPQSFRVQDHIGSLRDGELMNFGPEGVCELETGEELRVKLRPEAFPSPQGHDWGVSWSYRLPVRGWACRLVRTPVGRPWRRLCRALGADTTGCPRFDDEFVCVAPEGIRRADWLDRALAQELVDATPALWCRGANLINVRGGDACSMVLDALIVPTAEAVLESYQLAQRLRGRWAPAAPVLRSTANHGENT